MRIVMMGTGGFAIPSFEAIVQSNHDVVALYTRPTKVPARKRSKPPRNPMREAAEALGVTDIRDPDSINDDAVVAELKALAADLFVVCDYGQILSVDALAAAKLGGINLHASILPAYRGAAPINWAMYDGQPTTGITVIHMTPRLDAGPSLEQIEVPIEPTENVIELEERLAILGVGAVLRSIDQLAAWDGERPIGKVQDSKKRTKAPRLQKTDALVDWSRTSQQIFDQVRAFKPWPGTYSFCYRTGNEPLRVQIEAVSITNVAPGQPGEFVADEEGRWDRALLVSTGNGVVRLDQVKPEGRKLVSDKEFLNGQPIQAGDRMQGPTESS
jgi:methionyl-tRNA formyltransferase